MGKELASAENTIRWVSACELVAGQPKEYFERQCEKGRLIPIDFSKCFVLYSGLARKIYREYFGTSASEYIPEFCRIEQEINEILSHQGVTCITMMLLYDHSKRFAMIFSTPENISAQDVAGIVSSCFNRLYARIFDMNKTPYRNYTVLSEEIYGYDNLTKAFREIDVLSRQQFFDMRTMVMTPSLLESLRVPVDPEQIHEELLRMAAVMRAGDMQEFMEQYHSMMKKLQAARDFDLLSDVLSMIRMTLEGIFVSHGIEVDDTYRDMFTVTHYPTFPMMSESIENYIQECFQKLNMTKPMSSLIQEAVRYIRHHYSENISVADIAEHIGMSDSWLYKHFKQECGCSILAYLMEIRVEHAKVLLAETDKLIMEVACEAGFENPGYFISVFKKLVGMTPKVYREKQMAREA